MVQFARIAFVGLGQMGLPMARNLVKAGYSVTGFDLSEEARLTLEREGGKSATSAADTVADADCIITMLPNGKIVQDALLGDSAFRRAKPGALLLEMSSSAPQQTQTLNASVQEHLRLVDAPVSGGVRKAVDGTLSIMTGGADDDIDAAEPVLKAMAARIFRCGPIGAGHAMKAINNYVSGAGMIAAIEAVRIGSTFGIDGDTIVDVLNASTGKNNTTEVKVKQFMLSGTFASGFGMALMAKDIRIAANLARDLDLDLPAVKATADLWEAAVGAMGRTADHTALFAYLTGVSRPDGSDNS